MPSFRVETPQRSYDAIVERGAVLRIPDVLPVQAGKVFVVSTEDVWKLHGDKVKGALGSRPHQVLFFPGGEPRKRLEEVEALAEQMIAGGGDRSSVIVAFGGGIVDLKQRFGLGPADRLMLHRGRGQDARAPGGVIGVQRAGEMNAALGGRAFAGDHAIAHDSQCKRCGIAARNVGWFERADRFGGGRERGGHWYWASISMRA